MKFADLLTCNPGVSPSLEQQEASRRFPDLVRASHLRLWSAEQVSPNIALRLIIGTACYSVPDLQLLDRMNERLGQPDNRHVLVEVFDAGSCQSQAETATRIPGLGKVFYTPVVGLWRDGCLSASTQGFHARKMIEELLYL
jgi:hypothetical protein